MRVNEAVRCGCRAYACAAQGSSMPISAVPLLRRGRLQLGMAGRPVHAFAEADYCYGIGTLTLRVERIDWAHPVPHDGDTWLEVEGVVVDRTGRTGARREVLVRARRLPVRPPRKRPRLRP